MEKPRADLKAPRITSGAEVVHTSYPRLTGVGRDFEHIGTVEPLKNRDGTVDEFTQQGLNQQGLERLDEWFEALPYPLASICRAWRATPVQDFKTKYEHLLHLFEATAEFVSVIMLSAFS